MGKNFSQMPVFRQQNQENQEIEENAEMEKRADTDVETNLGHYSPLLSSASEDEFKEAINSEGSFMRERVSKAYKRKRNNRMSYSVANGKAISLLYDS